MQELRNITVFIIGPMTADSPEEMAVHEQHARAAAERLMRRGFTPINVHTMYKDMWAPVSSDRVKEHTARLLRTADAFYLLEGWRDSPGAQRDLRLAGDWSIPHVRKLTGDLTI